MSVVVFGGVVGHDVWGSAGFVGEGGWGRGDVEVSCLTIQDVNVSRGAMFSREAVASCWYGR